MELSDSSQSGPSTQCLIRGGGAAGTGCSSSAALCYLAPQRCFVREVGVSELLRLYLREHDRTPFHYDPQRLNYTTTTTKLHAWKEKEKDRGWGVSMSKAKKSNLGWVLRETFTNEQKQAPESWTGVFQTYERRPSRFPRTVNTLAVDRFFPSSRAAWWIPDEGGKGGVWHRSVDRA